MRDNDRAGDIEALRALKFDEDPRTIPEMIEADQYDDVVIEKAERHEENGRTTISWDNGTTTSVKGPEVKVGDTVRFYGGSRLGDTQHGWALNGELVEWRTPWERFSKRVEWLAQYDRDKRERFEKSKDDLDRRVAELPGPLKARIERFRHEDPKFRVDSEAYEMAAVGDAPKIARAIAAKNDWMLDDDLRVVPLKDESEGACAEREALIAQAVKDFHDLPYEEQQRVVPDLDDGHSGNTFGGAVGLARAVLMGKSV